MYMKAREINDSKIIDTNDYYSSYKETVKMVHRNIYKLLRGRVDEQTLG